MLKQIQNFLKDEEGASAIEYGLIAALISIVIVAAVTAAGVSLNEIFQIIADTLGAAVPAAPPAP